MKRFAVTFIVEADNAVDAYSEANAHLTNATDYKVTELDGDGDDGSHECEHACGRAVAPGVRFCSTACADCEGGGAPCSTECEDVAPYVPSVAERAAPDERARTEAPPRRKAHLRGGDGS